MCCCRQVEVADGMSEQPDPDDPGKIRQHSPAGVTQETGTFRNLEKAVMEATPHLCSINTHVITKSSDDSVLASFILGSTRQTLTHITGLMGQ